MDATNFIDFLHFIDDLREQAKEEFNSSCSNYDRRLGYYRGQQNILNVVEGRIIEMWKEVAENG